MLNAFIVDRDVTRHSTRGKHVRRCEPIEVDMA